MLANNHKALRALAKIEQCKPSEIKQDDWLILSDSDATEAAENEILNLVWAFNPDFLAAHTDVDADAIRAIQEKMCEDANPILLKLINDRQHFTHDAICADGRGHFLSPYDGQEIELGGDWYAYRIN